VLDQFRQCCADGAERYHGVGVASLGGEAGRSVVKGRRVDRGQGVGDGAPAAVGARCLGRVQASVVGVDGPARRIMSQFWHGSCARPPGTPQGRQRVCLQLPCEPHTAIKPSDVLNSCVTNPFSKSIRCMFFARMTVSQRLE
jgi:hypothetical protein